MAALTHEEGAVIPEVSVAERYDVEVQVEVLNSQGRVARLIGGGSKVLDLGCATGALGAALKQNGCRVVGVEVDKEAADVARERLDEVFELDLDTDDLGALTAEAPFDVVVLADVLEHLVHPEELLRKLPPLLARDGILITSIPNVAHGSVRLALLSGQFRYRPTGLLDATHVRFYTRESMVELLALGGFHVAYVEEHTIYPESGDVLDDVDLASLPDAAREAVKADPESSVYQFIAVSTTRPPQGLAGALARLGTESHALDHLRAAREELEARGVRVAELEASASDRERLLAAVTEDRERLMRRVQELEALPFKDLLAQVQGELDGVRAQLSQAQEGLAQLTIARERLRDSAADTMTRLRSEMSAHTQTKLRIEEWQSIARDWEGRCCDALDDANAARKSARWRIGSLFVGPIAWLRGLVRSNG
jgi:2-polyprenyl-3-methyl-5-hydroxy-6-metoxy-1,4-benzoquinol methylase